MGEYRVDPVRRECTPSQPSIHRAKGDTVPLTEPFEQHPMKYENWFEKNQHTYLSELSAVRQQLPPGEGNRVEIGVGTGRFAAPLGITFGIEPFARMREIAARRGINTSAGTAEALPLADSTFEVALMVTTVCFLDDVEASFAEVFRILEPGGFFVIGFVDKDSFLGREYQLRKEQSVFYRVATFYSVRDIVRFLDRTGFREFSFVQTIFHGLREMKSVETARPGYGEGSFVVVRAQKKE